VSDWRAMVVEDDRVVAGLHCRFVSHVAGYEVVGVAGTAARAEQMVEVLKPDLLLLDLGLRDLSEQRLGEI
jgi:response regulator of citrate/malate metabolism